MEFLPDIVLTNIFEIIMVNCTNKTRFHYFYKTLSLVSKNWNYVFMKKTRKDYTIHVNNVDQLGMDIFKNESINVKVVLAMDLPIHLNISSAISYFRLSVKDNGFLDEFKKYFNLDNENETHESYQNLNDIKLQIDSVISLNGFIETISKEQNLNNRFMNLSILNIMFNDSIMTGVVEPTLIGIELLGTIKTLDTLYLSGFQIEDHRICTLIKNTTTLKVLSMDSILIFCNLKEILKSLASNESIVEFRYDKSEAFGDIVVSISDLIYLLNSNKTLKDLCIECRDYEFDRSNTRIKNSTMLYMEIYEIAELIGKWEPDLYCGTMDIMELDLDRDGVEMILSNISNVSQLIIQCIHIPLLRNFTFKNLKSLIISIPIGLPFDETIKVSDLQSLPALETVDISGMEYQFFIDLLDANIRQIKKLSCRISSELWISHNSSFVNSIKRNQSLISITMTSNTRKKGNNLFFNNLISIINENKYLVSINIPFLDQVLDPNDQIDEFKQSIRQSIHEERHIGNIFLNAGFKKHIDFLAEHLISTYFFGNV